MSSLPVSRAPRQRRPRPASAPAGGGVPFPAPNTTPCGASLVDPKVSPAVREATVEAIERVSARRQRVQVKVERTGPKTFQTKPAEGADAGMMPVQIADALGTTSQAFVDQMMGDLTTYFGNGTDRQATLNTNSSLAVLDGMKPENEVEAMLLTQMVVTHDAAMRSLGMVGEHGLPVVEAYGGLAVKLLRTFTAQTEALAKLRRKGEQTVKVVHVYPGAQAVVGDVHHHADGAGHQEGEIDRDGTGASAERPALPSADPLGTALFSAIDAERQVQDARWAEPRRAEGQHQRAEARALPTRED